MNPAVGVAAVEFLRAGRGPAPQGGGDVQGGDCQTSGVTGVVGVADGLPQQQVIAVTAVLFFVLGLKPLGDGIGILTS